MANERGQGQRSRNPNEIGALWLKTSGAGKKYMSGKIEGIGEVVIFKNDHKNADNHPDYRIYKSQPRGGQQSRGSSSRADSYDDPRPARYEDETPDDIPF